MPKFIEWSCDRGTCSSCGPQTPEIISCPVLNSENKIVKVNEWYLAPRPGEKPQLELGIFENSLSETLSKLENKLKIAINHQAHLHWKAHVLKLDVECSKPATTLTICTDFGATLDLFAREKYNYSVNNHAVVYVICVKYGWKEVEYLTKDKDKKILEKNCE